MGEEGIQVDEATMQRWAELALGVRTSAHTIREVSAPEAGSAFAAADDLYPSESVSQWAREGLRSAVDHLLVWANHAVPLHQFDGQVVENHGFRWTFTLMRAAFEGASQSLWLCRAPSIQIGVTRLIRMVRHDLREEQAAWRALGRDVGSIQARAAKHQTAAEALAEYGPAVDALPSMVSMIRSAAEEASLDPNQQEANWRICSAAAHGKDWAIRELQVLSNPVEWRPGQFHMTGYPDAGKLTRILDDVNTILSTSVIHYLLKSGVDPNDVRRRSLVKAARETPQKDGGVLVEKLAAGFEQEGYKI